MLRYWPRYVAACRRRYGKVFTLRVAGDRHSGLRRRSRRHQDRLCGRSQLSFMPARRTRCSSGCSDQLGAPRRRRHPSGPAQADARSVPSRRRRASGGCDGRVGGGEHRVMADRHRVRGGPAHVAAHARGDPADRHRRHRRNAAGRVTRGNAPSCLSASALQTFAIVDPRLQRYPPWRRLRARLAEADRLLYAEIAERRADPNLAERTDALAG